MMQVHDSVSCTFVAESTTNRIMHLHNFAKMRVDGGGEGHMFMGIWVELLKYMLGNNQGQPTVSYR